MIGRDWIFRMFIAGIVASIDVNMLVLAVLPALLSILLFVGYPPIDVSFAPPTIRAYQPEENGNWDLIFFSLIFRYDLYLVIEWIKLKNSTNLPLFQLLREFDFLINGFEQFTICLHEFDTCFS